MPQARPKVVRAGARAFPIAVALSALAWAAPLGDLFAQELLWHVERDDGTVVDSRDADRPINPASVVKVATSLWALEELGPGHRFTTSFVVSGQPDAQGAVDSLAVRGGADPDFHVENALLVARALNARGVREVRAGFDVDARFWIGWEGGSARRLADPNERRRAMAERLRVAWSPERWSDETRATWESLARRRGWASAAPPEVRVPALSDKTLEAAPGAEGTWSVRHRSQPLAATLRRFNVFSNNDIERLEAVLGPAERLTETTRSRLAPLDEGISFETSSGLGRNRMTARQIVALLRQFRSRGRAMGLGVASLLPTLGCGTSTLEKIYADLAAGGLADGLSAKTGTLTTTDGGVAVVAGFAATGDGELLFALVAPGAGSQLRAARSRQGQWLRELYERSGAAAARSCGPSPGYSDDRAEIDIVATGGADPESRGGARDGLSSPLEAAK